MILKRKQARKNGTMKEFLMEQEEFERKKKARKEKESVSAKASTDREKKDEPSEENMRIDF